LKAYLCEAALANLRAATQRQGMVTSLPISKRGTLTLPPLMRRRLGVDRLENPRVLVAEREGGIFLQAVTNSPESEGDIPIETIQHWIAEDEAGMARFLAGAKTSEAIS